MRSFIFFVSLIIISFISLHAEDYTISGITWNGSGGTDKVCGLYVQQSGTFNDKPYWKHTSGSENFYLYKESGEWNTWIIHYLLVNNVNDDNLFALANYADSDKLPHEVGWQYAGAQLYAELAGTPVFGSPAPTITSATYNASTGALVVTGTNLEAKTGATNDIDATKFTITGQGSGTKTLTAATSNVEITSATSFTLTIAGADKTAVDALLNKNGTSSVGGTTYNLAAADNWCTNVAGGADATGNGITVSG